MRTFFLTCIVASAALSAPASALADEKAACLDAVSKGQTLRDEHTSLYDPASPPPQPRP